MRDEALLSFRQRASGYGAKALLRGKVNKGHTILTSTNARADGTASTDTPSFSDPAPQQGSGDEAYRYGNTRPLAVFGLALAASLGAVALVGGMWSSLDIATEQDRIAPPPNLKEVMVSTRAEGRELIATVREDLRTATEGDEQPTELARQEPARGEPSQK